MQLVHHSWDQIPAADVTIVISNIGFKRAQRDLAWHKKLQEVTAGPLCLWLDSDFGNWQGVFDRVLVVNRRTKRNPKLFRWVGWAADPDVCKPYKNGNRVFVDPYMYGFYGNAFNDIYDQIKQVLKQLENCSYVQPVPQYNRGRVSWIQVTAEFCRCTHYLITQPDYWGWTNIEAATAGAQLVVHKRLDRPATWPTRLSHVLWETPEDVKRILETPVDAQANRDVALRNTWPDVVKRVLEAVQ